MSEFDCGNRTDSCDNATICPCMNFINKETRSYSELLHGSLFREATKEERESVDNYIKSISKKLHTFTDEQLEGHDKQIRNDAFDEFVEFANTMPTVEEDDGEIRPMWLEEIAEQLKEQKNE